MNLIIFSFGQIYGDSDTPQNPNNDIFTDPQPKSDSQKSEKTALVSLPEKEEDPPWQSLPTELRSERAWKMLKVGVAQGWLDENFKPLVSARKASILAECITNNLDSSICWRPFEELWEIEKLRISFNLAMKSPSNIGFRQDVKKALK